MFRRFFASLLNRWWTPLTPVVLVIAGIPLLLGIGLVGGVTLYQQHSQQAAMARDMLENLADIHARQVERQFDLMVGQAYTLSQSRLVLEALDHLDDGVAEIEEQGWDVPDFEAKTRAFAEHLEATPDNAENDFVEEFNPAWRSVDRVGRVLQDWYIYGNPHPINHKFDLKRAAAPALYNVEHEEYHVSFLKFMEEFGYFDVMLVTPDGRIVYSVYKEMDFGTSVFDGPYKDTGMARVVREALTMPDLPERQEVVVSDVEPYYTTVRDMGAFIAVPVFNPKGVRLGALVLQVPVDKLAKPLADRSGLGKTGDMFILGPDQVMRTPHHTPEGLPPLAHNASPMAHMVAMGKRGIFEALNRKGAPILVVARSLNLPGLDWVMVTQQEYDEIYGWQSWHPGLLLASFAGALALTLLFSLVVARYLHVRLKPEEVLPPELPVIVTRLQEINRRLSEQLDMQDAAIFELNRAFAALTHLALQDEQLGNDINAALSAMESSLMLCSDAARDQQGLINDLKNIGNTEAEEGDARSDVPAGVH